MGKLSRIIPHPVKSNRGNHMELSERLSGNLTPLTPSPRNTKAQSDAEACPSSMCGSLAFRETLESGKPFIICRLVEMVSAFDRCKRALVILIRTLSGLYGCSVTVTRDSSDASVRTAYRKLSKTVHPDRGGSAADQSSLNNADRLPQPLLGSKWVPTASHTPFSRSRFVPIAVHMVTLKLKLCRLSCTQPFGG